MRITGGALRGRTVQVPKGEIRPAMDRMRESLFSILGDISGKQFLDLFSGSGIMSLEAVSRGCSSAVSVEKDPGKRATILKNLAVANTLEPELPGRSRITLRLMPVERFLQRAHGCWDIIFCDPPFAYRFKSQLLDRIVSADILRPGTGTIIIHHPSAESLAPRFEPRNGHPGVVRIDQRVYGGSTATFYGFDA